MPVIKLPAESAGKRILKIDQHLRSRCIMSNPDVRPLASPGDWNRHCRNALVKIDSYLTIRCLKLKEVICIICGLSN